ncbi:hypothetical protein [Bradyrhizobium sp. SYSU BS000235]
MESRHAFVENNYRSKGKQMLLPVTLVLTAALSVNTVILWGLL